MENPKMAKFMVLLIVFISISYLTSELVYLKNKASNTENTKVKEEVVQTEVIEDKIVNSGDIIVEFGGAGEVRFSGFVSDERYALVVSNGVEDHYYSASSETYYFHVNEKEIKIPRTKLHMQVKSHDNQKNTIHAIVKK